MNLFSDFSTMNNSGSQIFGKCASPKKDFDFKMRKCLEKYWAIYESHAEPNFLPGLKGAEFRHRWWEIYLWGSLHKMGLNLSQPKKGMPDICCTWGKQLVYFECVSPTPGVDNNKIKDSPEEKIFDIPEDEIVLRLMSSIHDKNLQAACRKGKVGGCHYIIAIDVSQLVPYGFDELSMLKALFPIGQESVIISNDGQSINREFSAREFVKKKTGSKIETSRFVGTKEYCQISSILFCNARFENVAAGATPKFFIVHNYHASRYLSRKMFRGKRQCEWNGYNAIFFRA